MMSISSTEISRTRIPDRKKPDLDEDHDYITDLPDCVLSRILSRLPTKDAVRTSVLSKSWEYKWTSTREIHLSDLEIFGNETKKANFVNFVERILSLSLKLQYFSLSCYKKYDLRCLETWITTALSRDFHSLRIFYRVANMDLPLDILNRDSLKNLELLVPCTFKVVPAEMNFPYLTTLKLANMKILIELSNSDRVKFTFPVLKTFELSRCTWLNVGVVEIYAPKLTSFSSETDSDYTSVGVKDFSINIIGTRLVKFKSYGMIPESIVLSGGSKAVSAYLQNSNTKEKLHLLEPSGLQIRKLLKELTSLKELELSGFVGKAIAHSRHGNLLPKFYHMERLVLSYPSGNSEELFELLRAIPFLKVLEITVNLWEYRDYDAEGCVPSCILSHLEIVKLSCFQESMRGMVKLAKFFVKNAVQLRQVVWNYPCPPNLRKRITEALSSHLKASTSLTFNDNGDFLAPLRRMCSTAPFGYKA